MQIGPSPLPRSLCAWRESPTPVLATSGPDLLHSRQESRAASVLPHRPGGLRDWRRGRRKARSSWSAKLRTGLSGQPQPTRAPATIGADARSAVACGTLSSRRCCTLLLYGPLILWDQDFDIWPLNWGGATGTRTPDFLHAMQRQDLRRSMYELVASLMRAHESTLMPTGCGTSLLYSSQPLPLELPDRHQAA